MTENQQQSGAKEYMLALEKEVSEYLREMYLPKPDRSTSFKEFQFIYNKWAEKRPEGVCKFAKSDTLVKAMEGLFPMQCGAPVRVKVNRQTQRYYGIAVNLKKKDALLGNERQNGEQDRPGYRYGGGQEPDYI